MLRVIEGDRLSFERRFSAFFETDLDLTLRQRSIDSRIVAGS